VGDDADAGPRPNEQRGKDVNGADDTRPRTAVVLSVNGTEHALVVEPRRTLLDALRGDLALTGTKKVCDMGDCGACTVQVDGRAVYACLLLAVDCAGRQITTIEGLGAGHGQLDPVQEAFIRADAFQCGFCTPGQIMSLRALLDVTDAPSDAAILRTVGGNLCRCGAYVNILRAGRLAVELQAAREPRHDAALSRR
jgi:xanthine dehydrogenase YagT iron-sulfur-binding subunit